MRFRKVFLLVSLITALAGQSLWGMNTDENGMKGIPKARMNFIQERVENLLKVASEENKLADSASVSPTQFRHRQKAMSLIDSALRLVEKLTRTDCYSALLEKVYCAQGDTWKRFSMPSCNISGCDCMNEYTRQCSTIYSAKSPSDASHSKAVEITEKTERLAILNPDLD